MESNPRAKTGAHRLRPLNTPSRVVLKVDAGVPRAVLQRARWRLVDHVEEVWRVDDGWWSPSPVARTYFRLALKSGHLITLYHDDIEGTWWAQSY